MQALPTVPHAGGTKGPNPLCSSSESRANLKTTSTFRCRVARPELVYIGSYPSDTVGILRSVGELGLNTKMLGGGLAVIGAAERWTQQASASEQGPPSGPRIDCDAHECRNLTGPAYHRPGDGQ